MKNKWKTMTQMGSVDQREKEWRRENKMGTWKKVE